MGRLPGPGHPLGAAAVPSRSLAPRAPELPAELEPVRRLPPLGLDGELDLIGARVEAAVPLEARRITLRECELRELSVAPDDPAERAAGSGGHRLSLLDVVLEGCDLSNVHCVDSGLRRVAIGRSRLLGFDLGGGRARDVSIRGSSLALASFADCGLENVRFEGCDLQEATFIRARLKHVEFVDCRMTGVDFRGARLADCTLRGTSLDGVVGVDSLRGLTMPWADMIASAGALAAALGIAVEIDE